MSIHHHRKAQLLLSAAMFAVFVAQADGQTATQTAEKAAGDASRVEQGRSTSGAEPAQSQEPARVGAEPDLVDLKLGMSAREAADVLTRRYPSAVRKAARVRWTSPLKAEFLGGLMAIDAKDLKDRRISHGEYVLLALAAPPNKPAVVAIKRTLVFAQGQESNREEWVKALEGKYGRATVRQGWRSIHTDNNDVVQLTWYFDKARPGDPKAASGPLPKRCAMLNDWSRRIGTKFESQYDDKLLARLADGDLAASFSQWMNDAVQNEEGIGSCGRALQVDFEVKRAGPGDLNSPFISRLVMTLTDHDGAAAAGRKTNEMIAGAAAGAATERVEQSRQNKPTL